MRLFAVTPIHVPEAELSRRQQRYNRLCPAGVTVELHDIGPDAPSTLDSKADVEASERLVQRAFRQVGSGYDGLLPDCALDPAVSALDGRLDTPVFGILRLSVGYALSTGRRCGALTRNQAIADALTAQVAAYGWAEHLVDVGVLDLDFDAIADDSRWNAAVGDAALALAGQGASWIVNACSAVDLGPRERSAGRVVDPVATALALLGAGETHRKGEAV